MTAPSNTSPPTRAIMALVLATAIWGAMFPIAKSILHDMDALTMTLLRYGIAAPVFLLMLVWREGLATLRPQTSVWPLIGLGGLGFAGFNLLMFYGIAQTKPEHGAVVMALQPLIAAMILWARSGKRPAGRSFVALALAIAGVVLLVTDGHVSRLAEHAAVIPTLMMIAGGTCWVLYSTGAARYPDWSPLRYTALTSTGGVLVLGVLWLIVGAAGGLRIPSAEVMSSMLPALSYITLLAAFLAVLCWNKGIRGIGAQKGMLFINVVPLTALFVGLLRGQAFGMWELVGAVLVLASLVLNQIAPRAQASAAAGLRTAAVTQA
ncbi:DMT family transporter [Uliginosibacterium sp. H3]|uniref:DMT family transporter n=1 Tax=Uliginosibacterium silvisoli TaxID=3114758 RepID=A0ABU6K1R5_9RHOO|nr:DMT family transporter [Uliginosibacterium sp. H3]